MCILLYFEKKTVIERRKGKTELKLKTGNSKKQVVGVRQRLTIVNS